MSVGNPVQPTSSGGKPDPLLALPLPAAASSTDGVSKQLFRFPQTDFYDGGNRGQGAGVVDGMVSDDLAVDDDDADEEARGGGAGDASPLAQLFSMDRLRQHLNKHVQDDDRGEGVEGDAEVIA